MLGYPLYPTGAPAVPLLTAPAATSGRGNTDNSYPPGCLRTPLSFETARPPVPEILYRISYQGVEAKGTRGPDGSAACRSMDAHVAA
jgi:hypothetical protein